jgi:hypothetical protein
MSGKPQLDEWKQFRKGEKKNTAHYWAICKHCDSQCAGVKDTMKVHLKACEKLPEDLWDLYQPGRIKAASNPDSKKRKMQSQSHFVIRNANDVEMSAEEKKKFEVYWLHATLDANLSFMWGEYDHVDKLMKFLKPSVEIPCRRRISGPVLDAENDRVFIEGIKKLKEGHSITLVLDSWKSIQKKSLFGVLLVSADTYLLYDLKDISESQHTGAYVHQITKALLQELHEKHRISINAIVTDGGSEMAKMRRLMNASNPSIATVWCISHLLNLLFGDLLKSTEDDDCKSVIDSCVLVVNWICNRQVALGLLRKKQLELYQKEIALVQPGDTRWNSYVYCLESLEKTSLALRTVFLEKQTNLVEGLKRDKKKNAEKIIKIVIDSAFWEKLGVLKRLLCPLAACVDKSQADNCDLCTGAIIFLFLYYWFQKNSIDYMVRKVEKRWLSMDVKAYILAIFLHPGFHGKGFDLSNISLLTLTGIVVDFYKKFFGEESPGISEVRSQFAKYMNCAAPYEKSLMTEFKNDPMSYWNLYASDKNSEALARLALVLLSIQITGASVERIFSACGIVQTAPRNRIKLPKLVKMVRVKGHISLSRERKSKVHLQAPQPQIVEEKKDDDDVVEFFPEAQSDVIGGADSGVEELHEDEEEEDDEEEEFISNLVIETDDSEDEYEVIEEGACQERALEDEPEELIAIDLQEINPNPLSLSNIISREEEDLLSLFRDGLDFVPLPQSPADE